MDLPNGPPGHPIHPPLTDATIGIYTAATAFSLLSVFGVSERNTTKAWWLALVVGLVVTVPTAPRASSTGWVSSAEREYGGPRRPISLRW